ncbi:MAG: sigma-70 family RNA polymerase sigma factor [Firmicutes bacterium]|nr:sigma-70 family RNA polymerase sigma factor [Bacillota bacterium]
MDDEKIVSLYWERDEQAIAETASKYGKLCNHIANNILSNHEDCEECINDTYLALWNSIPSQHPNRFSVFLSRITRNLALKKYDYISAAKRNPSAVTSLEELGDCISGTDTVESEMEKKHIEHAISQFLQQQEEEKRNIFIRRYWYFDSIQTICRHTGFSQSKVKSMLYEMRCKLRKYLEKEGIEI